MKRLIAKATILMMALIFAADSKSQSNKLGTWEVLNVEYDFNKKVNLWAEAQLRSQKMFDDFFYHELKGGLSYSLNKSTIFLVGVGQYATYANGGEFKSPMVSHEFRMWEQLTLVNNIGRVKIEHRYRVEQRWVNSEYRNRFRYRLNPILPINKPNIEPGTLFASVYDEIFLTNKGPFFERNRFFVGAGYMISRPLSVQVGWVRQFDYSLSNPGTTKDLLQTTLFFRLHHDKDAPFRQPSSID